MPLIPSIPSVQLTHPPLPSDQDFFEALRFLVWHSPKPLEPNTFMKISVKEPPPQLLHSEDFFSKGTVSTTKFTAIYYNTVTQMLTFQSEAIAFNSSKRMRGGSLGAPPAGETGFKYDLLAGRWVPKDTPFQGRLGALKAQFAGALRWVFW